MKQTCYRKGSGSEVEDEEEPEGEDLNSEDVRLTFGVLFVI